MHGVSAPMYYVALMTFILIFSSVTMVLAVDAGHQMKKDKVVLYVSNHYWWDICRVTAWEWKNFIKGEYGAIETKGGSLLQFVDKEGHRVALADFAVNCMRKEQNQIRQSGLWAKVLYLVFL
jgi:cytochrome c oxidase subunit 3